ncbi:hypothetical protein Tco_1472846 [Tanacetum coccineum]
MDSKTTTDGTDPQFTKCNTITISKTRDITNRKKRNSLTTVDESVSKSDTRVSLMIPARKVERRGMNERDNDLKVDEKGLENGGDVSRGEVVELNDGGDGEGEWKEEERECDEME